MDLEQYKKAWTNQPDEKNKISAVEIYKMTQSKSTSIVKWIFIIGLLEIIVLNALYFVIDLDEAEQQYKKLGLEGYIFFSQIFAYAIGFIFMVRFYLNYRNISTVDTTKNLMAKILKTRRTVKTYVFFNLAFIFITLIIVSVSMVKVNMDTLSNQQILILVAGQLIFGIVVLVLLWLFYLLIYGILLKKLKKNYNDLAQIDRLN